MYKIIPDTNVIVSASILENLKDIGIVKHTFYDESIQLFSLFKKQTPHVEGIAIPKVKSECFRVLSQAVKDTFVPKNMLDLIMKEKFYDNAVSIISSSEHKMRGLLSKLRKTQLDQEQIAKNLHNVNHMSKNLKQSYDKKYKRKDWRRKEIKKRAKPITSEPKWQEEQKKEVIDAHGEQVGRESKQLERFVKKYPNTSDQEILAQVITFKISLNDPNSNILIASSDTGFFSPYHYSGGTSDTVTMRIWSEFGIICDHPRQIFKLSGGII